MPIAAGYCAVTGRIDISAIILFVTMVFWQMPHFFSIAIFRMKDYRAGNIPILPLVKGVYRTKVQILIYTVLYIVVALSLSVFGRTGYIYAIVMLLVGADWLWKGARGFRTDSDTIWARKMFVNSLKVLLVFCLMVAVGGILP
jgi:protoheme IX farnesyltransferase